MIPIKFRIYNRAEYDLVVKMFKDLIPEVDTKWLSKYHSLLNFMYFDGKKLYSGCNAAVYKASPYPIGTSIINSEFPLDKLNSAIDAGVVHLDKEVEEIEVIPEPVEFKESPMEKVRIWPDAMVDIETLGTDPGDVILSVAIRLFDMKTGEKGPSLETGISLADSIYHGFKINLDTVNWWSQQSKDALTRALSGTTSIEMALDVIDSFFDRTPIDAGEVQVWGNSNRFDLGLLTAYYKKLDRRIPWMFWNERDVRTLVSFSPEIKAKHTIKDGQSVTTHIPLEDCDNQIKYCSETFNKLKID